MKMRTWEFLRARRLAESPAMATVLARAGLPATARGWGIDWVEVDGPLYRPVAEGGRVAAIVPVFQDGGTIDLVATSLETRATRRRYGLGTLLGEEHAAFARRFQNRLRVFADPISWLVDDGAGVVVLDWDDAVYQLNDIPAFACESEALALRLKRAFAGTVYAMPSIFVPSGKPKERSHAA